VGVLRSADAGEAELTVADRCKIRIDLVVAHFGKCGRLPARRLVLVDQCGSHAFVKVVRRHDMLGHPVFEGECCFEIVIAPDRQLAQGEFEARWRFCQQNGPRLRGPPRMFPTACGLCGECVENRLDAVVGEAPVNRRPQYLERCRPWVLRKVGEHRIDQAVVAHGPPGSGAKLLDQLGDPVTRHKVRGKAAIKRVGRPQPCAGQAEVAAYLPGATVEKPRGADIGKQPDRGLGHSEERTLGGDAIRTVNGNPGTAAHRDPVDDRDVRLGKAMDVANQLVFFAKEDRR